MPQYKLTYLNERARGETARMLFQLGGVDFEDCRIDYNEWKELKPKTPTGEIPILEVDGKIIWQANAINRFLARKFGYAGKSCVEEAHVDAIAAVIEDLWPMARDAYGEQDPVTQTEKRKILREQGIQVLLSQLQQILEQNKGGDGWLVGDQITWADVNFLNMFCCIIHTARDSWDNYPKMKALKERVENHPKIAEWISKRP